MKLSVVIVSYNVSHFLEQCLHSVSRAILPLDAEVYVVDNASTDDSVELVGQKFPGVKIIANSDNKGFSKANNQAIEQARGEYVLLLNPDTVVAEDTLIKCANFMDEHPDAGALGVHMVDGKGNFLPESKRGLPTPMVAFCKMFGFSALFPKSKLFGRYHLGFLPESETSQVDVLSGAFMFIRRSALEKAGLLDEVFFMYGEDIDLSYRILKAGFKNYYYPDTSIIHYKGESTKKGSLNYVKVFYQAMLIFARKHFSKQQSGLFSLLIYAAIFFRGGLTLLANAVASSYLFVVDAVLGFAGIYFIKRYWEDMIKYSDDYYPQEFLFIVVPLYILIWVVTVFFAGGYDKPFRTVNVFRGILIGTVIIAVIYAFIPDEWRFSRAMILLGAAWTGFEMLLTRSVYHLVKYGRWSVEQEEERRSMVAGQSDAGRAESMIRQQGRAQEITVTAQLTALKKAIAIHRSNQVVFCAADFSYQQIIQQIIYCGNRPDYKILNTGSHALIGSNSKNTAGDLYVSEQDYALLKPHHLRNKRVFDIVTGILLLLLLPITMWYLKNFKHVWNNWMQVMQGKKTWVGFGTKQNLQRFPTNFAGVIYPSSAFEMLGLDDKDKVEAELAYARHFSVSDDVALVCRHFKSWML